MLPPETALAVSWWSYHPGSFATLKGRKRGRFYLPYIYVNRADSQGKLGEPFLTDNTTTWQSFINDVQGMHTDPDLGDLAHWDWVTYSAVDATAQVVDWVSIDNHFDSQRRRQHQDAPARVVLPITHS